MGVQLSFGWPRSQPRHTERLFFAILPDGATAVGIEQRAWRWRRQLDLPSKPIPAQRLHISLYGLGEFENVPASLVEQACRAAAGVAAEPFCVSFDRLAGFGSGSVVLCGRSRALALLEFRHRLGMAIASEKSLMPFVSHRPYAPHVTVLYRDEERFQERAIEAIGWTAREFVLVHSLVGRGRHVRLGRWRLAHR